jgi:ABC-type taurine transport system substrate-binding protein
MKSIFTVTLLSIASLSSVFAADSQSKMFCTTGPDAHQGFTSVTITAQDEYTATLSGFQSGGIAHFVRNIGPFNVKISHEADATIYSNKEEDINLSAVTLGLNGRVVTTASFEEGRGDSLSMHCQAE